VTGLCENPDPRDSAGERPPHHIRQGPAAGDEWQRLGEHAQGMTREEYADYMRQLPAAEVGDQSQARQPQSGSAQGHLIVSDLSVKHHNGEAGEQSHQETRLAQKDIGNDGSPRELTEMWPPSQDDLDRVRGLYKDYLADMAAAETRGGRGRGKREQGQNAVGHRPDRSPADFSDLPPPCDKLIEMESSKKSRFSGLLHEAEKEDTVHDLYDVLDEDGTTVQRLLSARPPEGHAEQPVPVPSPHVTPWAPEHGIEGGNAATAVLAAGIVTIHAVRWINDKLRHGKDDYGDRD
jgi:hypothetical protein